MDSCSICVFASKINHFLFPVQVSFAAHTHTSCFLHRRPDRTSRTLAMERCLGSLPHPEMLISTCVCIRNECSRNGIYMRGKWLWMPKRVAIQTRSDFSWVLASFVGICSAMPEIWHAVTSVLSLELAVLGSFLLQLFCCCFSKQQLRRKNIISSCNFRLQSINVCSQGRSFRQLADHITSTDKNREKGCMCACLCSA